MIDIFVMGFLLGMRHATDSDHLAAVASLLTRASSYTESIRLGAVWGFGHTLTLLLFGSLVLSMGRLIPAQWAMLLEFAVAVMLVVLGLDLIRRLLQVQSQNKIIAGYHQQNHAAFPFRALFVGVMHGLAGTAALMMLTLQTVPSFSMGLVYIVVFGVGSILGMALLSLLIAVPLRRTAQNHQQFLPYVQAGIAGLTIFIGLNMMLYIDTII